MARLFDKSQNYSNIWTIYRIIHFPLLFSNNLLYLLLAESRIRFPFEKNDSGYDISVPRRAIFKTYVFRNRSRGSIIGPGYKGRWRIEGGGRIRGNMLGARIYTYLMRARSCKKQLANCSPAEWLGQILLFKSHSHRAKMLLAGAAKGISKEKCSRRLSRMHKHNPRIMYISKSSARHHCSLLLDWYSPPLLLVILFLVSPFSFRVILRNDIWQRSCFFREWMKFFLLDIWWDFNHVFK